MPSENVTWHEHPVKRDEREGRNGHESAVLWFTGLPASGKSTLSMGTEKRLFERGCFTYVLDGDNVRHGLCGDLGFSPEDRNENIRRVGQVAKLFADAGALVAASFVSPYREVRDGVREMMDDPERDFIEIFVDAPVPVCEERDPKGLYEQAREGEIDNFTGIDAPYEEPGDPALHLRTDRMDPPECIDRIVAYLEENGYLQPDATADESVQARRRGEPRMAGQPADG